MNNYIIFGGLALGVILGLLVGLALYSLYLVPLTAWMAGGITFFCMFALSIMVSSAYNPFSK